MADKTAQEQYADVRKSLVEVGQHGIAWQLDKAWLALRAEARVDFQAALDAQAKELAAGQSVILHDDLNGEATVVPVLNHGEAIEKLRQLAESEPVPGPGQAGEGGGASSQAGVEDKGALPGGVIA